MNREEWIENTGYQPTQEEWEVIQAVYTFHPSISNANGKREIALIYRTCGMGIIFDMLGTAKTCQRLEMEADSADRDADRLSRELAERIAELQREYTAKIEHQKQLSAENRDALNITVNRYRQGA
jgi:hypothetical protein